jgi:ATP-dependent DNA helicase RecQ
VGEYNQLHLTKLGLQVLRGEHTPKLLKPASKSPAKKSRSSRADDPASWEGVDRGLFDSLRQLRKEIATEQGVPAYIVFGDATLRDLARLRPTTEAEFLAANGVGQKKCEDYSQQFLEHITEYYTENEVAVDNGPPPKRERPAITASAIAAFPHFKAGKSIDEIAAEMDRAESTIYGYLTQFISHEQIADPSLWVDQTTATRICEAIESVGAGPLSPIFEHLNKEVPYHEIRIVATCLANAEAG